MADSDFAGCLDTGKSTTGYMIFMNGAVVAYYLACQSTVALCTAMAETIALTKLVVKVKHMRALMAGLTHPQEGETVINTHVFGLTIRLLYLLRKEIISLFKQLST